MLLHDMGDCDPLGRVVHYCSVSAAGMGKTVYSGGDMVLSGAAGPRSEEQKGMKIERGSRHAAGVDTLLW